MKKSLLAILLALCMVMTLLPATALADGETWADDAVTSWYDNHENDQTYTITTAAELAGLAELVNGGNDFSGKTITLGADIDLAGKEWTPIGQYLGANSTSYFSGTFDGAGNTISGLKITQAVITGFASVYEHCAYGLFGAAGAGAVFEDLTIVEPYIDLDNAKNVGALLGGVAYAGHNAPVTITDVDVVNADLTANARVGGIAGWVIDSTRGVDISNCSVTGNLTAEYNLDKNDDGDKVGGIVGQVTSGSDIYNCTFSGDISAYREAAGIVGRFAWDVSGNVLAVTECSVTSTTVTQVTPSGVAAASTPGFGQLIGRAGTNTGDRETVMLGGNSFSDVTVSADAQPGENGIGAYEPATSEPTSVVAKFGGQYYTTLQDAIVEAKTAGSGTVTLLCDTRVEVWNQIWDVNNVTIEGGGHTLTIGSLESGVNGNFLIYSAENLNVSNLTVAFETNGNGFDLNSGELTNVHMKKTEKTGYAVFVGIANDDEDVVKISNCSFEGFDKAIFSQPDGREGFVTADIVITESGFNGCGSPVFSYAADTTFEGNTVTDCGFTMFAGGVDDPDAVTKVENNTFDNSGMIKFHSSDLDNVTFKKNSITGSTYVTTADANSGKLDIANNYWGGGAPSSEQLVVTEGSEVEGEDLYYTEQEMGEEDLSTYCTVTYVTGTGAYTQERVLKGTIIPLPEAPTNSGYIFLGWRSGDTTYKAGDEVYITSDTTFVAVWGNLPDVKPSEPETPDTPVFPFYDVTARDWYYSAVKYVYEKSLMDGVDVGVFAPNDTLTRAMVWTIIARAEGVDTTGGATWYAKAQEWVTAKGISDGENPTAAITRQELVTMLYRLAGEPAVSGTITAPDAASVSNWAQNAMTWAMNIGLVEGDENGAVTPTATATRAQAAALIMRYLEA